jgi:hypothetical protein
MINFSCTQFKDKGYFADSIKQVSISVLVNWLVRYLGTFIVITNSREQVFILQRKIRIFLRERCLKANLFVLTWLQLIKGRSFNFLGFTFRFLLKSKISRITKRVNKLGQRLKPRFGLFVYVSNNSILALKLKLKKFFLYARNDSISFLIIKLNRFLCSWIHHYGLGCYRVLDLIETYIFRQCFKFVCKKFSRRGRRKIVATFFLMKIGKRSWNFHVFNNKLLTKSKSFLISLSNITTLVKVIPVICCRPISLEFSNVFFRPSFYNLWNNRIHLMRYKKKVLFF